MSPNRGANPTGPGDAENDSGIAVHEGKIRPAEPPKFAVVLLNDDYTTMEFVLEVLQKFFRKTADEAMQVMLRVHQEGRGAAGVYAFDIAETKVAQVEDHARQRGFPLRCKVEPA